MWDYDKKLLYPVRICRPDPAMAKLIITQLGGPDGELGAAMRYLTQRYAQPYAQGKAILTDIGTDVPEMVCLAELSLFSAFGTVYFH